ncbi:MAG: DUF1015 domain-containing protein [Candidatus Gastranaerophilales bacterium]|nr:DUF1015 domain-containing protein [Candidatus Gastranaerophilales bacterium]
MEVLPLNAIVYNQEKVDMKDVVAPPYDVIDEKYQDELYARSEFNCVRLILNKAQDRYSESAKCFSDWKEKEILVHTNKPAIFYIVQKYTNEKGKLIERKGFIARNKIEDFESKKILPHEFTMGGPKEDRFKLVSATGAFYSQIFMVYNDEKQRIESEVASKYLAKEPYMDITDDLGIQNLIYLIDDSSDIAIISEVLSDKTLLIADGHHRYETSMRYAKEHPENEYAQYVMSYFTNAADENLVIYPTHRIVEKDIKPTDVLEAVKKHYDVIEMTDKDAFLDKIEEENKKQITTGLILRNDEKYYVLKLKEGVKESIDTAKELQNLDLTVLHEVILKGELGFSQEELMAQNGIKYEKKENVSFESVKSGNANACFIMAYPKMKDIIDISSAGLRMPQKSTYFYPKLLSGIVINPLS